MLGVAQTLVCRPCNKEELYTRAPQVVQCSEAAREATLYQSVGGKSLGRSFHFDRVSRAALHAHAVQPHLQMQAICSALWAVCWSQITLLQCDRY